MTENLPDLNQPFDNDVQFVEAINGLMWYKLYNEHHYWALWVNAVLSGDEYWD